MKGSMIALKTLVGVFLVTSMFAEGQNPSHPVNLDNHIKPGTRLLSQDDLAHIQEEKDKQIALATDALELEEGDDKPPIALERNSAKGYTTSHMGCFYRLVSTSLIGDSIYLSDGSFWLVDYKDAYKTLHWLPNDLVVITLNHEIFSNYLFKIHNQDTGATVRCNLDLVLPYDGIQGYWIYAIDYFTQTVVLNDGSIWGVSSFDASTFNKWVPGDVIMIGINDGFLSSYNPNLLINVTMLNWVGAKCSL